MVSGAFGFPVSDGAEVWYGPYVEFAAQNGILSVLEYRPQDFVTREVAASILYRSLTVAGDSLAVRPLPQPAPQPLPQPVPQPGPPVAPEPAPVIEPPPERGRQAA